ncbi:acyl-homoserine-lactone synthase [Leisingera sp. ANG-M7]|uniref:acyl-homoserine-lactone synthase n=1 Tax=Leisingera sp. ANG-M7 TaxID=1577902 RepID=UPI0009DD8EF7|nr:acyl-homoserine-lactone synthase [Leisingera sp. ANG-M7]
MNTYWANCLTTGIPQQLLRAQFQLRKALFVDNYRWQLPTIGELEADQYDTPYASYCLTERNGKLAASARILPTSTNLGTSTYMILDAALGRLSPSLPPELCSGFVPPSSERVWEATRLTVCPSLTKLEKRAALRYTVERMMAEARAARIDQYIAIGGIELSLGVRSAGYQVERLTPFLGVGSGKVAIYKLPVVHL